MAVRIDTVYQRVLAIANKEQRGYITPIEFNLMANQAQMDIFEKYFYDLDQAKNKQKQLDRSIEDEEVSFSDIEATIRRKMKDFKIIVPVNGGTTFPTTNYKVGKIFADEYRCRFVDENEWKSISRSRFHKQGLRYNPIYKNSTGGTDDIMVMGWDTLTLTVQQLTLGVSCEIMQAPAKAEWGYDVVGPTGAKKALYNASNTTDFELHVAEETNLVTRILELAGIIVQDPGIIQYADQEGTKKIQLEKA
jgi:hypothetical protein